MNMIAKNKQLQLVDDDIEHTHTRCQIIPKAAIHALIHDYQSLILKDKQTRHSKIKTTILKSWRSENHTPHYYWLNQTK